jgi:type IV secretion system protein TrbC
MNIHLSRRNATRVAEKVSARFIVLCGTFVAAAVTAHAEDPFSTTAIQLRDAFTGTIAKALMTVAVVVGGLTLAHSGDGTGQGKRVMAGLLFGGGLALGAVQVLNWLFPY